jgi:undecaprenyl diphosphate synthase
VNLDMKKTEKLIGEFILEGSEEATLLRKINPSNLPQHIAIIMDGNGRWAKQKGLKRVEGHKEGVKAVREVIETCAHLGIKVLTLYAFSNENWKRPRYEINTLMKLLREYLYSELSNLTKNNIVFNPIGRIYRLPKAVVNDLEYVKEQTKNNTGLILNLALNYGARTEISDAFQKLYQAVKEKKLKIEEVNEEVIDTFLYTKGQPHPDLLIRTSGEMRVSNFLLWQIAYAEIWVTSTYWPDFNKKELFTAIIDFQKRERRYGGL